MSIPIWLEYANAIGTLTAAGFAAWTIRQSAKSSAENQQALIRERRIDFELGILAELAELNANEEMGNNRTIRIGTKASMLPIDMIPITRAAVKLESTPEAEKIVQEKIADKQISPFIRESNYLKEEISREVLNAITSRLSERGR
ncbi:hypothetical protein HS041_22470 [Planomonospora sp. ID67723]|uniref:hypothetical protein n=1 Tax=Planomonospora sp. ID67723 TaxID=2738134 RepID=UPI0018C433A4|nr:hypothetical protein [Planomonospora sp. ID67723]MBG0830530.1 hypothetical protein [Planomonospora sp. ID67723]